MSHFEKLLNVPVCNDSDSTATLFEMYLPDPPSAAALSSRIPLNEVTAAIKVLKQNKASGLCEIRSECFINAA